MGGSFRRPTAASSLAATADDGAASIELDKLNRLQRQSPLQHHIASVSRRAETNRMTHHACGTYEALDLDRGWTGRRSHGLPLGKRVATTAVDPPDSRVFAGRAGKTAHSQPYIGIGARNIVILVVPQQYPQTATVRACRQNTYIG